MISRNTAKQQAPAPRSAGRWARAGHVRQRARRVLNGGGGRGALLTLVLAIVILLTASVCVFVVAQGGSAVAYLLGLSILWQDILFYALLGVLGLFLILPLGASAYRLVCLSVLKASRPPVSPHMPITRDEPELIQLLRPFRSRADYGRCMAVGLETAGWLMLMILLPLMGYRSLAGLFVYLEKEGMAGWLATLLTVVSLVVCILFGVLILFLSGKRMGFGYLAFIHNELPVGEVNRYFRSLNRGFVFPFVLRLSLVGWMALSVAAVLIPFVLYTGPLGLCCSAVYGAELEERS